MAVLILDPDPACVEKPHAGFLTARSSGFTLTLQASSERQRRCRSFMSCIPVVLMKLGGKISLFSSCKVLFHIFLSLL